MHEHNNDEIINLTATTLDQLLDKIVQSSSVISCPLCQSSFLVSVGVSVLSSLIVSLQRKHLNFDAANTLKICFDRIEKDISLAAH